MNRKQSSVIQIIAFSITAVVLIFILIAGLTGHFMGGNFQLLNFGSSNYYRDADKYTVGSGEINGDDIRDIEVNWLDGSIDIAAYDGDTIKFIENSHRNLEEKNQLTYYSANGQLIIQYRGPKGPPISLGSSLNKDLTIMIPKKVAANLEELYVDAISSETKIEGINSAVINCDLISGDILLVNCVAAELGFDSTSGSLTGNNLTLSNKLSADTISGSVKVNGKVENLSFDTISGSLELDSDVCPSEIDTDSVSGSVTLAIPENDGFSCSKDFVSSSFTSDFEVSWHDDKGVYKNGGADFNFESVSGGIIINRK